MPKTISGEGGKGSDSRTHLLSEDKYTKAMRENRDGRPSNRYNVISPKEQSEDAK